MECQSGPSYAHFKSSVVWASEAKDQINPLWADPIFIQDPNFVINAPVGALAPNIAKLLTGIAQCYW